MRILIVSPNYWPEEYAAGVYVTELTEALAAMGHSVTALVPFPNYPEGRVRKGYRGKLFQTEHRNGVRIRRCFILPVDRRRNLLLRAFGVVSFSLSSLLAAPWVGRTDLVYAFSPPATHVLAGWLVSRLRRASLVIGAKDLLYRWMAVQAGNATLPVRLGAAFERPMFFAADHIQVASHAHRRAIEALGIPPSRITYIPDWADPEVIHPMDKRNAFRSALHLDGDFVALYSGNMGYTSALEPVIEAAARLQETPNFKFVLVGDGPKRAAYEEMARSRQLRNVLFLPLQPREIFPQVLASADAGLITLGKAFTEVSGQGKMYSIMAAGRPILAVMDEEAMGADLIQRERFGVVVPPDQPERIASVLRDWQRSPDLLESYGARARQVFLEHFTIGVCAGQFDQLFRRVSAGRSRPLQKEVA